MRTRLLGFAAASGLAVAVSALALAPAAMADPTPSPTASPEPTPTPSPTVAPVPKAPAAPPGKTKDDVVDASIKTTAEVFTEIPPMTIVKFQVRSDKPVSSYRVKVKTGWDAGYAAPPNHPGWECDGGFSEYDCRWTGEATTTPGPISLALSLPKASSSVRGTVSTTEQDSDVANNSDVAKILIKRDEPKQPQAKPGTIAGRVWHDANSNGRQDRGEKGVAGARIVINVADGMKTKIIKRTTTGADGRYSATLAAGESRYGVTVATPTGTKWTFTDVSVGAERGDSDVRPAESDEVFESWFGKDATVGIHDRTDVFAGKTTVIDAGLILKDSTGNGGGSLPKTGAAVGGLLGAGALLLGGGAVLTVMARRRRMGA
jgi:LPXTG-motif cell wall-anchored protein